jgi:hypothetical protein
MQAMTNIGVLQLKPMILVAAVAILLGTGILPAHAGGPSSVPGSLKEAIMTIDDKADKYDFIFVGERRFQVPPSALILNRYGRKIGLEELRVPCKATVTYQLFGDHRDPLVEKIRVR